MTTLFPNYALVWVFVLLVLGAFLEEALLVLLACCLVFLPLTVLEDTGFTCAVLAGFVFAVLAEAFLDVALVLFAGFALLAVALS